MRTLKSLIFAGMLATSISGCGESAEDISRKKRMLEAEKRTILEAEEARIPQIIPANRGVIYHVCYPGTEKQWDMYKYDFGGSVGSYAKIKGIISWYEGDGKWRPVEDKLPNDPWLRKLNKEIDAKIDAGQVEGEGLTTE